MWFFLPFFFFCQIGLRAGPQRAVDFRYDVSSGIAFRLLRFDLRVDGRRLEFRWSGFANFV